MKKALFILLPVFTVANAIFLSLGIECLLNLLSISSAVSLDGKSIIDQYSGFILFCILLGLVALIGVICMLFINIKASDKFKFNKTLWYCQYICAFVLSIPMIKPWEMLFVFLQKTF